MVFQFDLDFYADLMILNCKLKKLIRYTLLHKTKVFKLNHSSSFIFPAPVPTFEVKLLNKYSVKDEIEFAF